MDPFQNNLQLLPRVSDGWTFLYAEHVRVDQDMQAITLHDDRGRVPVPVASLTTLMLGPGSTVTHAAMNALAKNGCSVLWCGEGGVRLYACGIGETHRAANVLAQAEVWADPGTRMEVVMRMYRMRFADPVPAGYSLEQLRGMEGVRVRETYAALARETGVRWSGRAYKRDDWATADPVNRALSAANACLYGLCHGAIVATGFSPALGFIHTGRMLAFVYDIADLYKCDVTIPAAFREVANDEGPGLETRVRRACRAMFRERRLLARVVPDIQRALGLKPDPVTSLSHPDDADAIAALWDPTLGAVPGGRNFAEAGDGGAIADEAPDDDRDAGLDEEPVEERGDEDEERAP